MDPVTHAVIGLAVSKLTGNGIDLSSSASIAIVAGSVFPDADIVLKKWGDYIYLKYHRVVTHSVVGLPLSAIFIAAILWLTIPGTSFFNNFIWALVGGLSHTIFDMLNSYGAKLLWPFYKKKIAFNNLVIFDPIFISFLIGYIFSHGLLENICLYGMPIYLIMRSFIRYHVILELTKHYHTFTKISVLPSMLGIFRWHFILESKDISIVGEKNMINGKTHIIRKFPRIGDEQLDIAISSPVGKFFSDFTPLFHVAIEDVGSTQRYLFTDLRYYIKRKEDFFHHAILELDDCNTIIKASFNPYSREKSHYIPTTQYSYWKENMYKIASKMGQS